VCLEIFLFIAFLRGEELMRYESGSPSKLHGYQVNVRQFSEPTRHIKHLPESVARLMTLIKP